MASTSRGSTPAARANACLNRDESSVPAMPNTRSRGNPVARSISTVISSSGLVTTITTALGASERIASPAAWITRAFTSIKSARVMPGPRARPAVTTTTSAPATISSVSPPIQRPVAPVMPLAWFKSSAVAAASPGAISISTISSAMSAIVARCAMLPPTPPAPISASFPNLRALRGARDGACHFGARRYKDRRIAVLPSVRTGVGISTGPSTNLSPNRSADSRARAVTISPGMTSTISRPRRRASSTVSVPMTRPLLIQADHPPLRLRSQQLPWRSRPNFLCLK